MLPQGRNWDANSRLFDGVFAGLISTNKIRVQRAAAPPAHVGNISWVRIEDGLEGRFLPACVAGLIACPVIAVPTSVGYGTSFKGLSALLTMLNTCVPGIAVVNIDNGFGAGYLASVINQQ